MWTATTTRSSPNRLRVLVWPLLLWPMPRLTRHFSCWAVGPNSHWFIVLGDGHQTNSRVTMYPFKGPSLKRWDDYFQLVQDWTSRVLTTSFVFMHCKYLLFQKIDSFSVFENKQSAYMTLLHATLSKIAYSFKNRHILAGGKRWVWY